MGEDYQASARREVESLFRRGRQSGGADGLAGALAGGDGPPPPWDAVSEAEDLILDLVGVINAPLEDAPRVRFSLALYARLSGAAFLYDRLFNLLVLAEGGPPQQYGFSAFRRWGARPAIEDRVRALVARARSAGAPGLGDLIDRMFRQELRDGFLGGAYALADGEVRIRLAGGRTQVASFEEVGERLQMAIHLHTVYCVYETAFRPAPGPASEVAPAQVGADAPGP